MDFHSGSKWTRLLKVQQSTGPFSTNKFMKKYYIAIIGIFLLLYILPLGIRPIIIPDESRYAEIPREMIASGDWIVPTLNGLKYFEKPVLGYWLNAVSIKLFGENAFAVRFPSAAATGTFGVYDIFTGSPIFR